MKNITLAFVALTLAACSSAEAQVKQAIDEANYCTTAADCVQVGSKCPFDCYIYANISEADRIRTMVDEFESTCEYACLQSFGVACQEQKCVTITEQPPVAEQDPAGNVGAACTTDEECVTPMDYLIRSSCPFASRCIEGACAVVCPQMNTDPDPAVSESWNVACEADADCDCANYAGGDIKSCTCVNEQCVAVVAQ